jgi:hypothetical protein
MPTYGQIEPMTVDSLFQLRNQVPFQISMVGTSEVAVSRTLLAKTGVESKADLLLWIDSDMAFIPEQFAVLHQALEAQPEMGMISALAVRRDGTNSFCINWKLGKNEWYPPERLHKRVLKHIEADEIAPVDVTGFAFTLMWADVFEKIKKPWFQPRWLPKGDEEADTWQFFGEDSSFISKMKTAGYRPSVHFGVHVGHIGNQVYTPPPPQRYLEELKRQQEEEADVDNTVNPDENVPEDQGEDQSG